MDYILLGTIIGFTALTVLLWWNLCVQTTRAETCHADLNAILRIIDYPDSALIALPFNSVLDAELIQAAREVGKAKKAARENTLNAPKLKDIDVDFGTTVDASPTLLVHYDDSTAVVPLVTETQVKAIVSEMVTDAIISAAPKIVAHAIKKTTRRGAL